MGETNELAVKSFVIATQHPALTGHFPGNPLVPGVVIMRQVFDVVAQLGYSVNAVVNVKFSAMLLPDEQADITITEKGKGLAFAVKHGELLLASGQLNAARNGDS